MLLLSHLKLGFRQIIRNKIFSVINILGLSVGLSTCLLLFLFINNELSYDSEIPDTDRIYRITTTLNKKYTRATSLLCLHDAAKKDIPEVESTTCFNYIDKIRVKVNNVYQNENNVLLADSNFINFFDIKLLRGDAKSLEKPNLVLVTEDIASKYFGKNNPIGKNIEIDGVDYSVSGIIENPKPNIHFTYNLVVSLQGERGQRTYQGLKNRQSMGFYIYYKLFNPNMKTAVENKFPAIMKKYLDGTPGPGLEAFVSRLQPLKGIHLDSHYQYELKTNSYRKYITIFSLIGLLILVIAIINFINMYTASSSIRNKEIGLKKTIGASRRQLIRQFLSESFLINLFAFILAIILVELIRPFFNNIIHDEIVIEYLNVKVILFSLILLIGSTFLSGGYIAYYLSNISAISNLVGRHNRQKGLNLRDILVVFQFASAIALISSTLMINKQVRFMQNQELGFDKENILVIQMRNSIDKRDVLKEQILKLNDVLKAGYSHNHFARALQDNVISFHGKEFAVSSTFAEYDYLETMGLEFLSKNFEDKSELDYNIIINEALLNEIKQEFPESNYDDLKESAGQYKGIVKDFNFYSLHEDVEGFVFIFNPNIKLRYLHVKFKTENFSAFIEEMESTWTDLYPDYPFEYFFLDDAIDDKYNSDRTFGKVVSAFSIIAILISCIGLLGLSLFHTQQRTKEIGIRKTLGASTPSIIILLNKSYIRWILVSIIISVPFVYYYMNEWLIGFAYRIDFSWGVILISGLVALVIAFITISVQTLKSSRAKPVDSLRYE